METTEKSITFQTEDGWTIHGSLHLPAVASGQRTVPGVVLLHGAGHDKDAFATFIYPGMGQLLASRGIAALRIDWRGRGQSIQDREYHSFTDEQKALVRLDVKAALNLMAAQTEIDADRLAVFAEEVSAEWAVTGSEGDPRVKALAFISGRLSSEAQSILSKSPDLPVLCVVSKEDGPGLADMSAAFEQSRNPDSDLRIYEDMGMGTTMFTLWRYSYPDQKAVQFLQMQGVDTEKIGLIPRDPGDEKPIEDVICNWIASRLKSLGRLREVALTTEDDWTIYGNLLIPEDLAEHERVGGVVLLHSGWSDRHIFHSLERLFAQSGLAVLNIDWRGRGKSRSKGNYFTLPREERDRAHLDAKAAVNALAACDEVDPSRIAILGTYIGAKYAVAAALNDPRVVALVMLSGFIPTGKERDQIAGASFPILFIGSKGFASVTNSMIDLYELTRDRGSDLITYEGGALGYQLFDFDPELEGRIVGWVKHSLTNELSIAQSDAPGSDAH